MHAKMRRRGRQLQLVAGAALALPCLLLMQQARWPAPDATEPPAIATMAPRTSLVNAEARSSSTQAAAAAQAAGRTAVAAARVETLQDLLALADAATAATLRNQPQWQRLVQAYVRTCTCTCTVTGCMHAQLEHSSKDGTECVKHNASMIEKRMERRVYFFHRSSFIFSFNFCSLRSSIFLLLFLLLLLLLLLVHVCFNYTFL